MYATIINGSVSEADRAQAQVDAFLASALALAKAPPGPAPLIIEGVECCASCTDPIPPARLKALPGVGLCAECQLEREEMGEM